MKLTPIEYAKSSRSWIGEIEASKLLRIQQEVQAGASNVEVSLHFSLDESRRIHIEGNAELTAKVSCHRCNERVKTTISAKIDARIARNENEARLLAQEFDVIELSDTPVHVAQLIEDDLLLSIPWRVCDEPKTCENLPDGLISTPDTDDNTPATTRPFANIADLIKRK